MAPKADQTNALAKNLNASNALATTVQEVPSWIPVGDTTGTAMQKEDIKLPRLSFAQGLSPQLMPTDSAYIPDLKMFQMFNDLSGEVYGEGPLTFIPVRHDIKIIQFKPRSEGGGVLDFDVPPNDPRTQWSSDPNDPSKRVPPVATRFNEYFVLLVREEGLEPIALSIKSTNKYNTEAIQRLNSFIGMPTKVRRGDKIKLEQLPIYAKMYTIESKPEKNEKGTWAVPVIKQAGLVVDPEHGRRAMAFMKSLEGKEININREPGDEESFDTASMDATSAAAASEM